MERLQRGRYPPEKQAWSRQTQMQQKWEETSKRVILHVDRYRISKPTNPPVYNWKWKSKVQMLVQGCRIEVRGSCWSMGYWRWGWGGSMTWEAMRMWVWVLLLSWMHLDPTSWCWLKLKRVLMINAPAAITKSDDFINATNSFVLGKWSFSESLFSHASW